MGSMQEISGMPERIHSMCVKAVIFTSNSGMGVVLFFLQYKNYVFVVLCIHNCEEFRHIQSNR
jgi:hypothetical protein